MTMEVHLVFTDKKMQNNKKKQKIGCQNKQLAAESKILGFLFVPHLWGGGGGGGGGGL